MADDTMEIPQHAIWHSCGAWWTGAGRGHCGGCHETFSSQTSFDVHRRGGRCLDPVEAGLVGRPRRWGTEWGWPAPEVARFDRVLSRLDEGGES